jgi:hypothetical protein
VLDVSLKVSYGNTEDGRARFDPDRLAGRIAQDEQKVNLLLTQVGRSDEFVIK